MLEPDRQFLKDNLQELSENCNFNNVLGFLKLHDVFTNKQLQYFESDAFNLKTEELKCQQLFTDIQTRGPNAIVKLEACFMVTGHYKHYKILKERNSGKVTGTGTGIGTPLTVKMSTSFPTRRDVYKMTSSPRGYYIFINNIEFRVGKHRYGAECDQCFTDILDEMGYKGNYWPNQTKQEMRQKLKAFSTREDLTQVDSLIVAISSHGDRTKSGQLMVHGIDDHEQSNLLLCDEIVSLFNSDDCKLPKDRPKIFFIQACRGSGVIIGGELNKASPVTQTLNTWEDTFILSPCFEGLKAHRDNQFGSWLFMALIEVFKEHAHNSDLETMKRLINKKFDHYYEIYKRQQTLSYDEYGVTKKLYFNPGLRDPAIN